MRKKEDILDELFLTKEEELHYQIQRLADKFILKEEDMLTMLAWDAEEAIQNAKKRITLFKQYKKHIESKKRSLQRG